MTREARLVQDITRCAGLMAAVVADAERLRMSVPELALGCASAWRRWARHLAGQGGEDR
jgi:hypothetical protein